MLVLSRLPSQRVFVGTDIVVTVVEIQGHKVRLGFEAHGEQQDVVILREELARRIDHDGRRTIGRRRA